MLSQYAWLMVYGDVDDPSVEENGSDVYIHQDDVVGNERLCRGDVVTFYLYVDEEGLGAEECHVEKRAAPLVNPNAPDDLTKKSMVVPCTWAMALSRMQKVFSDISFDDDDCIVPRGPPKAFAFNEVRLGAYDDDEVHNDVSDASKPWKLNRTPPSDGSTDGGSTQDSEEEEASSGKAYDSEEEDEAIEKVTPEVKSLAPWKLWKLNRMPPSEGSTDEGSSGESEEETSSEKAYAEKDEASVQVSQQAKKSLPPNFRPPPGLSLPPWRSKLYLIDAS